MSARRERLLVSIPLDIKEEAARRAVSNMNDEMVGVLCARKNVPFEPTGYRRDADVANLSDGKTLLRVPPRLKHKIVMAAVRNRTNQTIEVCRELADEYGLSYETAGGPRAPVGGGRRQREAA